MQASRGWPCDYSAHLFILTAMAKDKKKHSKKDDLSENLLDAAALSVRRFRKVTKELGKLSTGQKLVGGLALVAAGLTYLATRSTSIEAPFSGAQLLPENQVNKSSKETAGEGEQEFEAAPQKSRKGSNVRQYSGL